jgi:hypothetical protein
LEGFATGKAQGDETSLSRFALGTAAQPPCFANTCERCSWTGHFVGLFPESTHHRVNASVELRSISPRLLLLDFSCHIQTGNSVIRGSNFDANLHPKWDNFGCNSTARYILKSNNVRYMIFKMHLNFIVS